MRKQTYQCAQYKLCAASHLRAETVVLPLRAHLEVCCQQFYASALQPLHPQSPNRHLPSPQRMIEETIRSQAPNKVLTAPPSNRHSRTTANTVILQRPLPALFHPLLYSSVLPPLCRLGR